MKKWLKIHGGLAMITLGIILSINSPQVNSPITSSHWADITLIIIGMASLIGIGAFLISRGIDDMTGKE